MARALLLRIGQAVISLLVLLVLTWGLVRLSGNPVYFVLPPDASAEQQEFVRRQLGLDQPLPVQFLVYVSGVVRGDLGISYTRLSTRTPVADMIAERIPNTVILAGAALLFIVVVAVPLGIYAAYWRGGWLDRIARLLAALGQSAPGFWVGILLILLFAVNLRILPSGGTGDLSYLILPTIALSLGAMAGLIRLLRSSMIEVLGSEYVSFHRMKGLPESTILWKHALRNAGTSSLTYVGLLVASLLTGSVLIETVFVWPGIGRLMVDAISNRDFNVIQGLVLVYGAVFIGVNLIVDVLYTVLNPRLR